MKAILLSLLIISGVFIYSDSFAQSKIFIKAIGSRGDGMTSGIFDGGSAVVGHEKEIEAFAYSDGMAGCAALAGGGGGGGGACKVTQSPFTFTMPLSFAVISFKYNLLVGKFLTSVDMEVAKNTNNEGGPSTYYKVHMEEVLISSISEGLSTATSEGATDGPTFSLEIIPTRIAWQVIKQNADGRPGATFSFGWDFRQNRKFNYAFP